MVDLWKKKRPVILGIGRSRDKAIADVLRRTLGYLPCATLHEERQGDKPKPSASVKKR